MNRCHSSMLPQLQPRLLLTQCMTRAAVYMCRRKVLQCHSRRAERGAGDANRRCNTGSCLRNAISGAGEANWRVAATMNCSCNSVIPFVLYGSIEFVPGVCPRAPLPRGTGSGCGSVHANREVQGGLTRASLATMNRYAAHVPYDARVGRLLRRSCVSRGLALAPTMRLRSVWAI